VTRYLRRTAICMTAAAALLPFASPAHAALAGPTVSVGSGGLSVRSGAASTTAKVGSVGNGVRINVICQQVGQRVVGRVRTTDRWDKLGAGQYVSDAYVRRPAAIPLCPPAPVVGPVKAPPLPPMYGGTPVGKWVVPVSGPAGSGYRTAARPEHDGVDISMARETPIRAAAAGIVVTVTCNTSGLTCDVDGSPDLRGCGWYVQIRHAADVVTRYCHLIRIPPVVVGQTVSVGQVIGNMGTSGRSSGPHLHFEVHAGSPATRQNAVDPLDFMRRAGAPIR